MKHTETSEFEGNNDACENNTNVNSFINNVSITPRSNIIATKLLK